MELFENTVIAFQRIMFALYEQVIHAMNIQTSQTGVTIVKHMPAIRESIYIWAVDRGIR